MNVDEFVVDETRHVVIHSDSTMFLAPWGIAGGLTPISEPMGGKAYETRSLRDNSRALVYVLPVPGYPWTAVVELPYALVLEDAVATVVPLLLLQALLVVVLAAAMPSALNRITRPITGLAVAAQRVAAGETDDPIRGVANDEVGQIAAAVNALQRNLADQRSVLETYLQSIAACASMTESPQSLCALLDRVTQATGATVARLVVQPSILSRESVVLSNGTEDGLEIIDRLLTSQLHDVEPASLLIPELAESELLDEHESLVPKLGALAALPVCLERHVVAVLWVGYVSTHDFDGVETDFLEAVASILEPALDNLRLKHRLKMKEEYMAAVLASTSDGVLISDADAVFCLVNPALQVILGIDPDAVLGSPISQSGLPQAILDLFAMVAHGLDPFQREIVLKDNRVIYAFVYPTLDCAGSESGRVVVLRDISATLGAGSVRGSLVFAFSERLRTPLTLIRGYATMTPLVGALGDRQKQYLEKILVGVGQVGVLVDDLMKLSVVESGTGLKREPTALSDVLIEAVDQSEDAATEKGVTLRLEPAERMAVVDGDRSLLHQAVVNLIDNGVKYTPHGGSVAVSLQVLSDHAIICVSDTGIGIDRDELPRIFDRFYRSDRQEVSSVPGVGLGLAIVKSIVEWHGGSIRVDSEMGQGSRIYVGLPLAEDQE